MTSFVQRFRAIHHPDVASSQHVHAVQSASHAASPSHDDSLAASITQLTATVAALAADQKELRAAFTPPHGPAPPQRQSRPPSSSKTSATATLDSVVVEDGLRLDVKNAMPHNESSGQAFVVSRQGGDGSSQFGNLRSQGSLLCDKRQWRSGFFGGSGQSGK
eukprot:gene8288-9171_t